jgi:hypothetical protein
MGDMENKRGTKRKVPKVNNSTPHSSTSKNRKTARENPVVNAVSPTSTSRHQISITSPLPSTSSDYHQSSGPSGYPKFQGQAKKKKGYEEDRLQQSQHEQVPRTAVHPTTVETELDVGSRTFFNISGVPAVRQPLTQHFQHSSPHVSSIQQQHPPQQHHRPGSVDLSRQQDLNRGAGDVANDSILRKTGPLQQRTLFDFFPKQYKPLKVATRIDNGPKCNIANCKECDKYDKLEKEFRKELLYSVRCDYLGIDDDHDEDTA